MNLAAIIPCVNNVPLGGYSWSTHYACRSIYWLWARMIHRPAVEGGLLYDIQSINGYHLADPGNMQ